MAESLPVSLLEDLHAAAADGAHIHNLLCDAMDLDAAGHCSCGVASVLRQLAELLPLPAGAAQPYRPAWVPAAA
jgi:hypothetical protein